MGKIKDSNSVVETKKSNKLPVKKFISLLISVLLFITWQVSVKLLKISENLVQYKIVTAFVCITLVASIVVCILELKSSMLSLNNKEPEYKKIGKYYDPSIDYDNLIQKEKDKKDIKKLEEDWYNAMDVLKEQIELCEGRITTAETTEDKLTIQSTLQHMYERYKVAGDFVERFNSTNNLPLLKSLYRNGNFVDLKEAEEIKTHYDDVLFCSDAEYQRKRNIVGFLNCINIFFGPLLIQHVLLATLVWIDNGFTDFAGPLLESYVAFGLLFPVTVPVSLVFWWVLLPRILEIAILDDKLSEKDKKDAEKRGLGAAIGSGFAIGSILLHIRKSKK